MSHEEFEPVSKGVPGLESLYSRNTVVPLQIVASRFEKVGESSDARDPKSRMGFGGGNKRILSA